MREGGRDGEKKRETTVGVKELEKERREGEREGNKSNDKLTE